ncbi:MAG: porin family protein [Bacteroidetes bacterium]|nr:porin family protein [Bacteroidota bacterium]MBU1115767.1 porin family protein [Bacteroidota bacterium]MBU1799445.1 porin family protein [Bacteroidota bacterium]
MKKLGLILLLLLLASGTAYSQSIGAFAGYGSSAFGDDVDEESNYIPVGAQLLFGSGGNFEFGVEVNYAVVPFIFSKGDIGDMKINQLYYGALAKFKFGTGRGIWPYLRAGAGMYTGTIEYDFTDEINEFGFDDVKMDFKNAFGFNVGAGAEMNISGNNGLFVEFVYHIVDRELDVNNEDMEEGDSSKMTANNWAIHVGFRFGLN